MQHLEESKNNEIYFQLAVLRAWWACCQSQARSSSCLSRSSLPSPLYLFLSSLFLSCSNSLQVWLCTLSLFSCVLVNNFLFQSLLFTCASILFPSYPLILLARHFFFSARLLASCSVCITMPPPPSSSNVSPKPLPPYLRPWLLGWLM